jgi:hypothetical protein
MANLQKKAKGQRPRYFEDPATERILSITLALAGEVSVLRDRVDTIERLAARGEPFSTADVDAYVPDPAVRQERDRQREVFLEVVLRCIHQEIEGMQSKAASASYDAAIADVRKSTGHAAGTA